MLEHKHLLLMSSVHKPPINEKMIESWMLNLIETLHMKPLIVPKAVYCEKEGNKGMTCICAIETSHIVLHSWDEKKPAKIQLDVYSCLNFGLTKIWQSIRQFEPFDIHYKFYDRQNGFTCLDEIEVTRICNNLLNNKWHFAKTMPTIPHWYTRSREWKSIDEFAEAVDLIESKGVDEMWNGKVYKYFYLGDFKYWTMESKQTSSFKHILINRAKI